MKTIDEVEVNEERKRMKKMRTIEKEDRKWLGKEKKKVVWKAAVADCKFLYEWSSNYRVWETAMKIITISLFLPTPER